MFKVLLVSEQLEMKDEVRRRLGLKGEKPTIYWAECAEEAREYLTNDDYGLVVAWLHVKERPDAPEGDENTIPALKLVRWLRNSGKETPCILVRPPTLHSTTQIDMELGELPRCYPLFEGPGLLSELASTAARLGEDTHGDVPPVLDIEIRLGGDASGTGENAFTVFLDKSGYKRGGSLQLDEGKLRLLKTLSENLGDLTDKGNRWKKTLHEIGYALRDELSQNAEFRAAVEVGLEKAGHAHDYSHTRLVFVISRDLHPVVLEAVLDLEKGGEGIADDDLWMLEAPIYRRLWGEGIRGQDDGILFSRVSVEPIRSLIIDAGIQSDEPLETDLEDPERPQAGRLKLAPLPEASKECDLLKERVAQASHSLNLAEPVLLRREPGEKEFWKRVRDTLKGAEPPWDLVHYAGHSYYGKGKACLFFQVDELSVREVSLAEISGWLSGTRLVFLSSCQSASTGFVFTLAEYLVPGILGFRWPIDDGLALEYAERFYKHLFDKRSVQEAYFQARREMHEAHEDRNIWAAPVFIEQR